MRHSIYVKRALAKLKTEHRMNHSQLRAVSAFLLMLSPPQIQDAVANPPTDKQYAENFMPGKE